MKRASLGDSPRTKLTCQYRDPTVLHARNLWRLWKRIKNPADIDLRPGRLWQDHLLCHGLAQQQVPTAWLSLDEHDNDPFRFWDPRDRRAANNPLGVGSDSTGGASIATHDTIHNCPADQADPARSAAHSLILVLEDYQFSGTLVGWQVFGAQFRQNEREIIENACQILAATSPDEGSRGNQHITCGIPSPEAGHDRRGQVRSPWFANPE